ncbi:molybdopterin/thiamine biosynthesis adenylyltransferase [Streptomyces canus]|uniref:ThiF family adenylyltransferase n=1 Tax=Streptomyces canus TaxID=58343 RepID=UPI0027886D40|nr:ThiF family adenylyltransferase [Streptomyces canus]MDQ0598168.1 molybdopterin/thiamine biosynthesis adenylyltransferase [Streptomyces canus]
MGRFERHELIPGWDQQQLAAATVVVVGVGALGSQLAQQLALAGIGRLVLCDPDSVSEGNLSRAPLFRADDIGRPKAPIAARRLGELSPVTCVDARTAPLVSGVGLAELRDASLVVGCLDSLAARLQLAGRCQLVGVPLLDGGTSPWGGEIRLYDPSGACFGCGLTPRDRAAQDDPWACADATTTDAGASAPVSALIGAWLAVTVVRLLCGAETTPGLVRVDAASGTASPVRVHRDPDCPLHARIPASLVSPTPHTVLSTPADLAAHLAPEETVMTWAPLPGSPPTQQSTRLTDASPHTPLAELDVAPREILPVLGTGGTRRIRYLELSEAGGKGRSR